MEISLFPLETIPNPETDRRYTVEMTAPEWTALCPRSGFPDFATIRVRYTPREKCVELKAFKLYLNSYRNVGIFHEMAVNRIARDLIEACDPWELEVEGDFHVRGNIKTVVRVHHVREKSL